MADLYGLELYDANGFKTLSITDRLTTFVATQTLNMNFTGAGLKTQSFSFSIPTSYVGTNTAWAFPLGYSAAVQTSDRSLAVHITASTITFEVSYVSTTRASSSLSLKVMYGMY